MSFFRAVTPLAFLCAAPCTGLLLPGQLGGKKQFALTEFGNPSLETCAQVCASLSLGCDFRSLKREWDGEKDMKKEVQKLSYKCKGTKSSGSIDAPFVSLSDAKDTKGTCFYPKNFDDLSCDAPAPDESRRLCYCTEAALAALAVSEYQSIWPYEWVFPAGEGQELAPHRYEACICYAKKGAHGPSAIPAEIITLEDRHSDNGAYSGACATFCHTQTSGPHHAADVHFLADWSTARPCIIVLHGQGGSKDEQYTQMMARKFADAGFVVLSLNYDAGDCEKDIGNAVEYVRTIGASFGIDPNSVALYGWSQGGRCAYKAGYKNMQVPNQSVKAVIDMSGCGGKGPLNGIDRSIKTMPPPLLLAHAENDNTIKIKDCHALVAHAAKKSWDDNGSKGSVPIKELYFSKGGHNLLKNSNAEPIVIDEIFDHLFKYLGRPCKGNEDKGILGYPLMDGAWPKCKTEAGESIDRCGGVYDDFTKVKRNCDYP